MEIINWLLKGDIVLQSLTQKYLLGQDFSHEDKGYVSKYLNLFDKENGVWGGSIYSGKWTSSTYTLLELKYMEISPDNPIYQIAAKKVLDGLWQNHGRISKTRYQDMCMSAMVLSLISYGNFGYDKAKEIVDYILAHQMEDGGWNCAWDSAANSSSVGSVHTTISVLEALNDFKLFGNSYRPEEIEKQSNLGRDYLLKRELCKSLRTGEIIHPEIIKFHYPCRWKYDYVRGFEYFAKIKYPYDKRMDFALSMLKAELQKGFIGKGKRYSGNVHFLLEEGTKSRFNTFRALLILKEYDKKAFNLHLEKNKRTGLIVRIK